MKKKSLLHPNVSKHLTKQYYLGLCIQIRNHIRQFIFFYLKMILAVKDKEFNSNETRKLR